MGLEYAQLGEAVSQATSPSGSIKILVEYLPKARMPGGAVSSWVASVKGGQVYGTPGTPQDPQQRLDVLAVLLRIYIFPADKQPVSGIKEMPEIADKFVYPPPDSDFPYDEVRQKLLALKGSEKSGLEERMEMLKSRSS